MFDIILYSTDVCSVMVIMFWVGEEINSLVLIKKELLSDVYLNSRIYTELVESYFPDLSKSGKYEYKDFCSNFYKKMRPNIPLSTNLIAFL